VSNSLRRVIAAIIVAVLAASCEIVPPEGDNPAIIIVDENAPIQLVYSSERNGSIEGSLHGAEIDEPFEARLEVADHVRVDRVEWLVDGQTYRSDYLRGPYNIRYRDVLPIDKSFGSDQGLPGRWELEDGRRHSITAVIVAGDYIIPIRAVFDVGDVAGPPPQTRPQNTVPPTTAPPTTAPPATVPPTTVPPTTVPPTTVPPTTVPPTTTAPPTTTTQPAIDPSAGGSLTWAPPSGWQNFRTVDVSTAGGTINLGSNDDVRLVLPDAPVRRTIKVQGGRHVVVMGGEIEIADDGGYDNANMGLRFFDQTGTSHVEGGWMHGAHLTEGIQFGAPDADAVLQNLRIAPLIGSQDRNHADLVQPWGGLGSLRIDGLTGASRYQGLMLKADRNGTLGPVTVKNTNIEMVEGDPGNGAYPNNGGRFSVWHNPGSGTSSVEYVNGTVWVDTNSRYNGGSLSSTVWPQVSSTKTDGHGQYVSWDTSVISGRIHHGNPPGGDYVPAGSVGRGYSSPGWGG